jgi:hypothetical protein
MKPATRLCLVPRLRMSRPNTSTPPICHHGMYRETVPLIVYLYILAVDFTGLSTEWCFRLCTNDVNCGLSFTYFASQCRIWVQMVRCNCSAIYICSFHLYIYIYNIIPHWVAVGAVVHSCSIGTNVSHTEVLHSCFR